MSKVHLREGFLVTAQKAPQRVETPGMSLQNAKRRRASPASLEFSVGRKRTWKHTMARMANTARATTDFISFTYSSEGQEHQMGQKRCIFG